MRCLWVWCINLLLVSALPSSLKWIPTWSLVMTDADVAPAASVYKTLSSFSYQCPRVHNIIIGSAKWSSIYITTLSLTSQHCHLFHNIVGGINFHRRSWSTIVSAILMRKLLFSSNHTARGSRGRLEGDLEARGRALGANRGVAVGAMGGPGILARSFVFAFCAVTTSD